MQDLVDAYRAQAADRGLPEHWSGPPEMVDRIAAALRTSAGHLVVDVGCGIGGPAVRLARLTGCTVLALDRVVPLLVEARRRIAAAALVTGEVHVAAASAVALPLVSAAADQIWCLGVVAHVPETAAVTREAARVVRPGGTAVYTEAFWDGRRTPRFESVAPRPWQPLTVNGLERALRSAGFRDVRVLPWPGEGLAGATPHVPELADDLTAGRLASRMVVATR